MTQPVEDALQAALQRSTAGLDDNPARYQEVAARSRLRRRRTAASAGLATVALAVLAVTAGSVLTLGGEQPDRPAGPSIDCPAPLSGPPSATPGPTQTGPLVPEGPIAARACGTIGVTLHLGLDRLVATLNALPPQPAGEQSCEDIYVGPPYQLVLAYPDGSQVTAVIEPGGCPRVRVGDQVRSDRGFGSVGSEGSVASVLFELAEEQRWADAPADPPPPACPEPATVTRPTGDAETPPRFDAYVDPGQSGIPYPVVAVAVCRYTSTDPATAVLATSTVVTDGAERALELVEQQGPEIPFWSCEPPAGSFDVLVFSDEAGGQYEVRVGRGECRLFWSAAKLSDEPHPELQQWLDDTLGGPPPG